MVSFDSWYFVLNTVLLAVFTIVGRLITNKRTYWRHAIWCIIAFTLISGMRYARGNDYIHYTEVFTGFDNQADAAFIWLNNCLAFCGFNEYSCFLFYAFVFVTCGLFFLRDFIGCTRWTFPLFLIGYLVFDEYQIRQAFSYSFLFVFMHYLFLLPNSLKKIFQKRNAIILLKMAIWGTISIFIHSANIIILTLLVIAFLFSKYVIPYYIAIPIYVSCVYIIPLIFDFSWLEIILLPFSELKTTSVYVDRADYFFSEEGIEEKYFRNPIVQLYEIAGVSSLLYLAYKMRQGLNDRLFRVVSVFYTLFFIGVSIVAAFRGLELLHRIGHDLWLLGFLLLALVICQYPAITRRASKVVHKRKRGSKAVFGDVLSVKAIIQTMCYLSLTWFLYDYLKYLLMPGKMTLYIWDAPIGVSLF